MTALGLFNKKCYKSVLTLKLSYESFKLPVHTNLLYLLSMICYYEKVPIVLYDYQSHVVLLFKALIKPSVKVFPVENHFVV